MYDALLRINTTMTMTVMTVIGMMVIMMTAFVTMMARAADSRGLCRLAVARACWRLRERSHERCRASHAGRINPSRGTALETGSSVFGLARWPNPSLSLRVVAR